MLELFRELRICCGSKKLMDNQPEAVMSQQKNKSGEEKESKVQGPFEISVSKDAYSEESKPKMYFKIQEEPPASKQKKDTPSPGDFQSAFFEWQAKEEEKGESGSLGENSWERPMEKECHVLKMQGGEHRQKERKAFDYSLCPKTPKPPYQKKGPLVTKGKRIHQSALISNSPLNLVVNKIIRTPLETPKAIRESLKPGLVRTDSLTSIENNLKPVQLRV